MRCLLIDDDIPTLEALYCIMDWSEVGITEVITATNIHDAKHIAALLTIEIMICDIEMPRGSGIEMLKWVREQQIECSFIFLTCHESFHFASLAIEYNVNSYLLKPLDQQMIKAAIVKAIEDSKQKKVVNEYHKLGLTWLKNKKFVEKSFWRDVLMGTVVPNKEIISREITKRDLQVDLVQSYILSIISMTRSQLSKEWETSLFQYAFMNVCQEGLSSLVQYDRMISYQTDHFFYIAFIVEAENDVSFIKSCTQQMIDACKKFLKMTTTCYISENITIEQLLNTRMRLEELDSKNVIFRGLIHLQNEPFQYNNQEPYVFEFNIYSMLFIQKEKMRIVNKIKYDLELLEKKSQLDISTLHSIRQDFLQVIYSYLSNNYIQAHRLFSDEAYQKLYYQAESSVFDFVKWAYSVTDKSIEAIKSVVQSEGIIEKSIRYIHDYYMVDVTREDVAANVYLTADYLSKIFKQKTGMTVKDYINNYRIKVAKRLLLESDESISQIALETGFENISYFSTIFKKRTGESPNSYRTRHKHL